MSDNVITVPGRTATTIAAEIRCLDEQARRMSLFYIVEIGQRLTEAKEMVPTGEWGAYLKEEVNYSHSTANNFMQIYREYSVNGSLKDSQTFGNLPYSKALALLALPAEERGDFVEQNDVESMSVRQLKAAIKERDEARKAEADARAEAESARAETRRAEQALLDIQQKAAAAKSDESAWRNEIDKLNAALNKATAARDKAEQQVKDLKANPKIPAAMKEKLIAEAKSQAASEVVADLKAQLAQAQEQAQKAAHEKQAFEAAANAAEQKLAESQKTALLSDPDVVALNFLFESVRDNFNRANGYLKKITARDPEKGHQFKSGFMKLADLMKEALS